MTEEGLGGIISGSKMRMVLNFKGVGERGIGCFCDFFYGWARQLYARQEEKLFKILTIFTYSLAQLRALGMQL